MIDTPTLLLNKAKEAFLLAIEIYNKPTLRYRAEGFALFMVNAWELMLKAYLIKRDGEESIYYLDKSGRTISIDKCARKIFSNEKDPLRLNLEKIIELRNTSTHFITEEYEVLYVPLFQANIFNFADKLKELHGIEISEIVPENFLTLSVSISQTSEKEIKGKYSDKISEKLIELNQKAKKNFGQASNNQFAISINHYHYLTKNNSENVSSFRFAKDADDAIHIIKQKQDPNLTHPYNAKRMYELLNKRLDSQGVRLMFKGKPTKINQFHFSNLCRYYGIKSDERYCYQYTLSKFPQFSYSQSALDYLFEILEKNPSKILDGIAHEKKAL